MILRTIFPTVIGEGIKKPPDFIGGKIKKENLLNRRLFDLDVIGQFFVYEDASTVLAYHYFLMLFDLALFLGRDRIEATAAGISFYSYDSKTVTIALANLFITGQQPGVHV